MNDLYDPRYPAVTTADLVNVLHDMPIRKGGVLPLTQYGDNSVRLDWSAGIPGSLYEAYTAPARAYRGEIAPEQMVQEGLNFAGSVALGSAAAPRPRGSVGMGSVNAGRAGAEQTNGILSVDPKNLFATDEAWLGDRGRPSYPIDNRPTTEPILVRRGAHNPDELYIVDGHHRAASAADRGVNIDAIPVSNAQYNEWQRAGMTHQQMIDILKKYGLAGILAGGAASGNDLSR